MTPSEPKRLLLWRHAKASTADPRLRDEERPLTAKGERRAAAMATALLAEPPGLVLCSSAQRARQTLAAAEMVWSAPTTLLVEPDLYLAEPLTLLEQLSRVEEETPSVLVVGHQPGLEELVRLLVGDGDPLALTTFAHGFPTAALADLRLDIACWREIRAGRAFLTAFTPARCLSGET